MRLINRLSLSGKLTVIAVVAVLFCLVPTVQIIQADLNHIELTQSERRGIEPISKALNLMGLLQQHRSQQIQGDSTERLIALQTEIDSAFNVLNSLPQVRAIPALLEQTQALRARFSEVKSLKAEGDVALTTFDANSQLIVAGQSFIDSLSDSFLLRLDPDSDIYYLVYASTYQLPALAENFSQGRGLGAAFSTRLASAPAAVGRVDMVASLSQYGLHAIDQSLLKVINANANLASDLAKERAQLSRQGVDLLALLRAQVSGSNALNNDSFIQKTGASVDELRALNERLLTKIDALLVEREAEHHIDLYINMAIFVLMIGILAGLIFLISKGVLRQLDKAIRSASRIASGQLSDNAIREEGANELARLLRSIDDMRISLQERKNQESELMAENARIRNALDVAAANVMIADVDYKIIYTNQTLMSMLRHAEPDIRKQLPSFSAEAVLGSNIDQFHVNPTHQRAMLSRLTGVHEANLEIGSRRFRLLITPILGENNKERLGTVVEWQDFTDELLAQEKAAAVAADMARIKAALGNVTTNVMIADNDRNIIYLNHSVQKMLKNAEADIRKVLPNFDASNLLGVSMDTFHRNPAHQRDLLSALRSTHQAEISVGGRAFRLIANPVFGDDGSRYGTVVQWLDRTEEVAAEREVAHIIGAAAAGDFSQRLSVDGKEGFFKLLSENVNLLIGTAAEGLEEVAKVLEHLSRGDLTYRIDRQYEGVFGRLASNANMTVDNLAGLISQIRETTDTINTASREIAQGNQNLSSRTEQQAANLQETASSMEQITGTVRQNADNAQQASSLAATASNTASVGGQVVSEVVTTMAEINHSAKKIVDIISVIDGIAFQTNILALNAAVEAARAGEQGRGFAVVASEVRNLAQRSATAAKEIKFLIGDSVDKVESGSRLVDQAGQTMSQIVEAVRQVAELMSEISSASLEQSSGIEQINHAVTQMDENTQQNAALVEEAAAAAESLEEQASVLSEAVAAFRVSGVMYQAGKVGGASRLAIPASPVAATVPLRPTHHAEPLPMAPSRPAVVAPKVLPKPAPIQDDEWEEF